MMGRRGYRKDGSRSLYCPYGGEYTSVTSRLTLRSRQARR